MKYRAEIDGLRALAVVPVILFHAGFESFSGGFVGVDVFFVISGYLITTILIDDLERNRFSIVNFYERRARRILPALFFVMLVCVPFAWLLLIPSDLKDFSESLMAVSLFVSNILFWWESGYFETAAELKPLLHTWSLAVEEQYYILFPIFLMLTWRLGVKWILVLLSLVFVISLGVAHWATDFSTDPKVVSGAFFLLPTRGWELLVGVFAAFHLKHKSYAQSHIVNQSLSLIGLGMIVYSIVAFDKTTPFPGLYALVPTVGTGLLILSATPNTAVQRFLSLSPIVGIGLISYSAYLWHQPLFAFARHALVGEVSNVLLLVLSLASLVMAYFSWRYVESPFRDKSRTTRKAIFRYSLIGMVIFASIGAVGYQEDGFFPNLHKVNPLIAENPLIEHGDIGHDRFHAYVSANFLECESDEIASKADVWDGMLRCHQSQSGVPSVALFGDSHAEHLFLGIAEQLNRNTTYLIRGGAPFLGEESHNYLVDYIIRNEQIDTVIYSMYWWKAYRRVGQEQFRKKLRDTLLAFKEAGKKIVVVGDVPDFLVDSSACFFVRNGNARASRACSISAEEFNQQRLYLPAVIAVTNELEIEFIDPSSLFCNSDGCSMIKDRTIMYRDNDHLNIPASQLVGEHIIQQSKVLF